MLQRLGQHARELDAVAVAGGDAGDDLVDAAGLGERRRLDGVRMVGVAWGGHARHGGTGGTTALAVGTPDSRPREGRALQPSDSSSQEHVLPGHAEAGGHGSASRRRGPHRAPTAAPALHAVDERHRHRAAMSAAMPGKPCAAEDHGLRIEARRGLAAGLGQQRCARLRDRRRAARRSAPRYGCRRAMPSSRATTPAVRASAASVRRRSRWRSGRAVRPSRRPLRPVRRPVRRRRRAARTGPGRRSSRSGSRRAARRAHAPLPRHRAPRAAPPRSWPRWRCTARRSAR